ncbi:hypothetical protein CBR_g66647 [Chara braunii]|uniref:Uncharacterized protein n=1 Tax=Chara braunii TaxID=69332 RepID=A0A388JPW5_CHABU|nr:hypothetical protein CBR_g66647 [Chara braunii]|eukprot:GBG59844.1 hypothetical protein CBR_g66647 [Chara braunii]
MQAIAGSAALQVCAPTKALLAQREAPTSASASAARQVTLPTKDARWWRLSSAAAASDAAACFRGSDFFDNALFCEPGRDGGEGREGEGMLAGNEESKEVVSATIPCTRVSRGMA